MTSAAPGQSTHTPLMVERANVKAPASPEAVRRRDIRCLVRQQNTQR
jgi:hypothetical protein